MTTIHLKPKSEDVRLRNKTIKKTGRFGQDKIHFYQSLTELLKVIRTA